MFHQNNVKPILTANIATGIKIKMETANENLVYVIECRYLYWCVCMSNLTEDSFCTHHASLPHQHTNVTVFISD